MIALLSPFTNKDKRLTLNIPDPYDAHPPEDTKRLVEAAGFEIIRSTLLEKPAGGRNKGRLAIAARKRIEKGARV